MRLLQSFTLIGAVMIAAPALAQTSDRAACPAPYTDVRLSNKDNVVLHQNSPNPFAHETTISYRLPDKIKKARLVFYDAQGTLMKAVDITSSGEPPAGLAEDAQCTGLGRVTVFGDDLRGGRYTYVLVVDERVVESKTMVKE
jgi:hypothetical protein